MICPVVLTASGAYTFAINSSEEGDKARIISQYGEASLPVCKDAAIRKGEMFSTFNSKEVFINKITSPYKDSYTQTPEYKITAVRFEKITD